MTFVESSEVKGGVNGSCVEGPAVFCFETAVKDPSSSYFWVIYCGAVRYFTKASPGLQAKSNSPK